MVLQDRWIGLILAMSSSLCIGTSFIITKLGLLAAGSGNSGQSSDNFDYVKNPIWWSGMIMMVIGEIANFAAYAFAPPVLVTPLGALSVIIGAVLASIFLKEKLGPIGKVGCALCLIGSLVIILHAPEDKDIETVEEILSYAMQPAFMLYFLSVFVFCGYMIYKVCPIYGKTNPLVYLSICSTIGSISVMAIKGLGIAIKLTFAGENQFTHISTYVFAIFVVGCIMVQMAYFNKALDQFSTNVVNPMYYVGFSTFTIIASILLFQGFGTPGGVNTFSLLCGFMTIFLGVYLLNFARQLDGSEQVSDEPAGYELANRMSVEGARFAGAQSGGILPLTSPIKPRRSVLYDAYEAERDLDTVEEDGNDDDRDEMRSIGLNSPAMTQSGGTSSRLFYPKAIMSTASQVSSAEAGLMPLTIPVWTQPPHLHLHNTASAYTPEYDADEQDYFFLNLLPFRLSLSLFELIIDRFEWEHSLLVPTSAALPKLGQADAVCHVCNESDVENSNALVFCDECDIAVHQDCYGIPFIPDGAWLCRPCVRNKHPLDLACALCGHSGGAMKMTADSNSRWAHVLCALWVPETWMGNSVYMEPVDGLSAVPKSRWALTCSICNRKGACIQCDNKSCFTPYHVSCARSRGWLGKMKALGPGIPMRSFCHRHLSGHREGTSSPAPPPPHQHNTSSNSNKVTLPLLPATVFTKVIAYLDKIKAKPRVKPSQLHLLAKYWSLKRQKRRGGVLLKRLCSTNVPSVVSRSAPLLSKTGNLDKIEHADDSPMTAQTRTEILDTLRGDLERARSLAESVRKREQQKRASTAAIVEVLEQMLFPLYPRMMSILQACIDIDKNSYFTAPVDPIDAPDYHEKISEPMDYGTIQQMLNDRTIDSISQFVGLLRLVCDNAMKYNQPGTSYHRLAGRTKAMMEPLLAKLTSDCKGHDTLVPASHRLAALTPQFIEALFSMRPARDETPPPSPDPTPEPEYKPINSRKIRIRTSGRYTEASVLEAPLRSRRGAAQNAFDVVMDDPEALLKKGAGAGTNMQIISHSTIASSKRKRVSEDDDEERGLSNSTHPTNFEKPEILPAGSRRAATKNPNYANAPIISASGKPPASKKAKNDTNKPAKLTITIGGSSLRKLPSKPHPSRLNSSQRPASSSLTPEPSDIDMDGTNMTINTMSKEEECETKAIDDMLEHISADPYPPGSVVWARVKGYPWFPGEIVDPNDRSSEVEEIPANVMKLKPPSGAERHWLVMFFGKTYWAWSKESDLDMLEEMDEAQEKYLQSKIYGNKAKSMSKRMEPVRQAYKIARANLAGIPLSEAGET